MVGKSLVSQREVPSQRVRSPTAPPAFCTSVDKELAARPRNPVQYQYFIAVFSVIRCVTETENGNRVILIGINSDSSSKLEVSGGPLILVKKHEIKLLLLERCIFIRHTFF